MPRLRIGVVLLIAAGTVALVGCGTEDAEQAVTVAAPGDTARAPSTNPVSETVDLVQDVDLNPAVHGLDVSATNIESIDDAKVFMAAILSEYGGGQRGDLFIGRIDGAELDEFLNPPSDNDVEIDVEAGAEMSESLQGDWLALGFRGSEQFAIQSAIDSSSDEAPITAAGDTLIVFARPDGSAMIHKIVEWDRAAAATSRMTTL